MEAADKIKKRLELLCFVNLIGLAAALGEARFGF